MREKLILGKESAYLSKKLGTICLEAPIDTNLESYKLKDIDSFNAINFLVKTEMFGIIEKLGLTRENVPAPSQEKAKALEISEERDLPALMGEIKKAGKAYFLSEFDGRDLIRMYFAFEDKVSYAENNCFDFAEFFKMFCESDCEKYTADVKQLYKYALSRGVDLKNVRADTALMGYILNPSANSYEVKRLCEEYGVALSAAGEGADETALCCGAMPELCDKLLSKIEENNQKELLCDIEIPLSEVLASMENIGFLVNKEGIEVFGRDMSEKIDELTEKIYSEVGFEFNLNSPKQLGVALFEKLGLPCKKKTKSGYSTNAEVLEELADEYPVVSDILHYRTLAKLKSTYCEGLLKVIDGDGRIRSTLNQTETRTGRISSTEPNLQNIPVRSEIGREMRKFFVAEKGSVLVDADYSQIELRVLAHLSDDSTMIDAFNKGDDIHTITASQVFNMPVHMVTPLMRSRAKAVNFGIVYGIGAFSLSKDIGVTRKEADSYIKGYLHHYSGISKYLESAVNDARDKGYCETIFKRRRYLPELTASNKMLQGFGERVAKNMPVQGTAADIIKIAMVKVYRRLKDENMKARLIMQVHDELLVEAPENEREKAQLILKEEMENACSMKVKLTADVSFGSDWYQAKG